MVNHIFPYFKWPYEASICIGKCRGWWGLIILNWFWVTWYMIYYQVQKCFPRNEVKQLLDKGTVRDVLPEEALWHYSTIFSTPWALWKTPGCHLWDQSLHRYLQWKISSDTINNVKSLMKAGNFIAVVDLNYAYYNNKLQKHSRSSAISS